jgi:hypothetical protein
MQWKRPKFEVSICNCHILGPWFLSKGHLSQGMEIKWGKLSKFEVSICTYHFRGPRFCPSFAKRRGLSLSGISYVGPVSSYMGIHITQYYLFIYISSNDLVVFLLGDPKMIDDCFTTNTSKL